MGFSCHKMHEKVVLIVPKDTIDIEPLVYPPLGLLYIAAVLERQNYQTSIYDLRVNNENEIPEADIYGFTAVTSQIKNIVDIAKSIKEMSNKSFTILGGPHASNSPETVMHDFDCVVSGEGETSICEVIKKRKKGIVNASILNVNKTPFPARHLLPLECVINNKMWEGYKYGEGDIATTIISSRGCPFNCAFCSNMPSKIRFRNPDNMIKEINEIIDRYGCRHFRFLDDNFVLNKARLKEFCSRLSLLNINFRCSVRSDMLTDEICDLLLEGGCKEIGIGVESGDDKVLGIIDKRETVNQHRNAIELAKKHNLKIKVFLMAGLPGETWESIEMTKRFIQETQPDKWIATFFTPYPGSPIWKNPEKFGVRILDKNFDNYFQTYPARGVIETDCATRKELLEHFDDLTQYMKRSHAV